MVCPPPLTTTVALPAARLLLTSDPPGKVVTSVKAVPDELCDGIALCGPLDRIKERLELWKASPVTTLILGGVDDPAHLRALAEMV